MHEQKGGYQRPQSPQDNWAARLYQEHDLGQTPSQADIEPVATELLGSPLTALSGAELVLGRRVDAQEKDIAQIIVTPGFSPEERYGLLLMQKSYEEMSAQT